MHCDVRLGIKGAIRDRLCDAKAVVAVVFTLWARQTALSGSTGPSLTICDSSARCHGATRAYVLKNVALLSSPRPSFESPGSPPSAVRVTVLAVMNYAGVCQPVGRESLEPGRMSGHIT